MVDALLTFIIPIGSSHRISRLGKHHLTMALLFRGAPPSAHCVAPSAHCVAPVLIVCPTAHCVALHMPRTCPTVRCRLALNVMPAGALEDATIKDKFVSLPAVLLFVVHAVELALAWLYILSQSEGVLARCERSDSNITSLPMKLGYRDSSFVVTRVQIAGGLTYNAARNMAVIPTIIAFCLLVLLVTKYRLVPYLRANKASATPTCRSPQQRPAPATTADINAPVGASV